MAAQPGPPAGPAAALNKVVGAPGAARGDAPNAIAALSPACTVDEVFPHVGDRAAGRYYLFTMPHCRQVIPGRKSPEEVGRNGLHAAIVRSYAAVFPASHACHIGPDYGVVAQEKHASSPNEASQGVHLHGAWAFPVEHRWKAVERQLRVVEGIKVFRVGVNLTPPARLSLGPCLAGPDPSRFRAGAAPAPAWPRPSSTSPGLLLPSRAEPAELALP